MNLCSLDLPAVAEIESMDLTIKIRAECPELPAGARKRMQERK
jgi:hypothetical protein